MDELPPLEHPDDPFALLGVTPEVDERELKRAYARKIKVYRPDRAPEQFALIHAAFEHVRFVQALKRSAPAPDVAPEGAPEAPAPSAAPGAELPPTYAMSHAVAREDHVAAAEAWKAVRATGAPLEELVVDAPPPILAWLLDHVAFTWRELSQWRDTQAAFNVWMTTFARRVRAKDGMAQAVEMAQEPALLADAATESAPALLALNAVSCLAWRDQDAAERILRKLRSVVNHAVVTALHDRATLDVDRGGREYRIVGRPPLPAHVLELMADWPILSPPARRELAARLREALRADPVEYLHHLTGTAKRYPRLADALAHRLLDGVPLHRRELSELPDALASKLDFELRAASRKAPWFLTLLVVLLGVVTTVAAAIALAPHIDDDGNLIYAASLVAGAHLGAAMLLDRYLYQTRVRELLVVAIARAGVTRAAARQWIQANRRRVLRLFRFTAWMPKDDALRLVGMVAANVADDRELG